MTADATNFPDGSHDFDFLIGKWSMKNRYLKGRLVGSTEWETFDSECEMQPLPGGIGNMDVFRPGQWRAGLVGVSLRIYDPKTRRWTIYWIDNQNVGVDENGLLYPPVVGRFTNGVGIFEGDDTLRGKPIRVRYKWYDVDTVHPKWEQSMSDDGGKTWEVNFSNVFTRKA